MAQCLWCLRVRHESLTEADAEANLCPTHHTEFESYPVRADGSRRYPHEVD